jgi:hypothetical protein
MGTRTRQTPKQLKIGFLGLLKRSFGNVEAEARFPWLVVPDAPEMQPAIAKVHAALVAHRGEADFATPKWPLRCDYHLPEHRLIIEVDERQHFSEPRAVALRKYPRGAKLGIDRKLWISECLRIQAIDNDPDYRDEQRAFYDTLRDLLAPAFGMRPVIRLTLDAIESEDAARQCIRMIRQQLTAKPGG